MDIIQKSGVPWKATLQEITVVWILTETIEWGRKVKPVIHLFMNKNEQDLWSTREYMQTTLLRCLSVKAISEKRLKGNEAQGEILKKTNTWVYLNAVEGKQKYSFILLFFQRKTTIVVTWTGGRQVRDWKRGRLLRGWLQYSTWRWCSTLRLGSRNDRIQRHYRSSLRFSLLRQLPAHPAGFSPKSLQFSLLISFSSSSWTLWLHYAPLYLPLMSRTFSLEGGG